jgi:L-threonylcarbamoyladenylate synthase|tara:strand:+ start:22672 stop:23208 length:537 start_codon:yes stop_codon:yes gene_type:complete
MSSLRIALSVLRAGGVIAHHSDTVLGIACLPRAAHLTRMARIKMRTPSKPFLLLADSLTQLNGFVAEDFELQSLLTSNTKPTTYLVPASKHCPQILIGPSQHIAVRISQHPNVTSISNTLGAFASSSANLSGQKTVCHVAELRKQFGPELDYIYDSGKLGSGQSSRIIDLKTQEILRA